MNLTVADGFKLGCGVLLAGAFGIVLVILVISLAIFLARLVGISIPSPLG